MNDQQWIERYMDGELSEEERQQFEQRLGKDTELARAFQLEKDLMDGIEAQGNVQLRGYLDGLHDEWQETKKVDEAPAKPQKNNRQWLWAGLAMIVLLGFVLLLWRQSAPSPEKLYAQYAQTTFSFTQKSQDSQLASEAEQLLAAGKYKAALPLLNQLIDQDPTIQYRMARAFANVASGQSAAALIELDELAAQNSFYRNDIFWYKALAHLRQNNLPATRQSLQSIEKSSKRHPQAVQLLEELKDL
ncbi:MAG: hypothetical protein AAFV95_25850 [Bacteroidota bacterium]